MSVSSTLRRYRTVAKIASGGMATVTLAEDTLLGRPVALKRMIGTADVQGLTRLRREALVGASVSHPNLVSIYDVISEDEDLVIVMEYVDGVTLKEKLTKDGPLAAEDGLRVLRGVAAGLDAIHQRSIVHRDVKPANILLGKTGDVKLADLGIAAAPDRTSITTEGSVLGSFSYMSPEQLEGAPATPAMDIYALSAVAYETLSGRRARQEDNPLALAHAIATQPPPDLSDAWPEAPEAAAALLRRGMSRNPAERPRSAVELVQRLGTALSPEQRGEPTAKTKALPVAPIPGPGAGPPRAAAASSPRTRRRSSWLAPALLGLLALAVIVSVLASSGGTPNPAASTHRSTTGSSTQAATTTTGATTAPLAQPTTSSPPPSGGPRANPSGTDTGPNTATSSPPASSSTAGASTPATAAERFYQLAASHQYRAAWALADPDFRSQLDGYASFVSGQSGDRRIIFHQDQVVSQGPSSATVAVRTTSIRDNGTQQCRGTVDTVRSGAGWVLDQIDINCS